MNQKCTECGGPGPFHKGRKTCADCRRYKRLKLKYEYECYKCDTPCPKAEDGLCKKCRTAMGVRKCNRCHGLFSVIQFYGREPYCKGCRQE